MKNPYQDFFSDSIFGPAVACLILSVVIVCVCWVFKLVTL